jgi:hypothetical protein
MMLERITSGLKHLTGGRPMARRGVAFFDVISGKPVFYYRDLFGRRWLSDGGPWASFRVSIDEVEESLPPNPMDE